MKPLLVLALMALLLGPGAAEARAEAPVGAEALYRLDRLPAFKPSLRVGSLSSYDRSGGNDDGFSGKYSAIRKEPEGLVIADLEGPGVVYRIWTPTPTDDTVTFQFDGEATPRLRVKFRDLFSGREPPFLAPLSGFGAGGFYTYVPLPFARRLKVVVQAERVQFYQINYALYAREMDIQSFVPVADAAARVGREKAMALLAEAGRDLSDWAAPEGATRVQGEDSFSLPPRAAVVISELQIPGRIVGLRLAPASAFAGKARDVLLKITWDGEPEPAVFCPAGDFFGYAWGEPAMRSLLLGTAGEVNYCYFPMPFDHSAKIELLSLRETGPPIEVRAAVVVAAAGRKEDEGKFHAVWRREQPTRKGAPFTFATAEGRGHVVACILQAQGPQSGNTYFFEGDDQTLLDGELAVHGTGSEDFFNGGWYDVPGRWEGRLSFSLSGCLGYQKHLGRTGGYRLFLGDAYAYRRSLRHEMEHAPTGNDLDCDYSAVTFLYCDRPPQAGSPPQAPAARAVRDPGKLTFAAWWSLPIHAFSFQNATLTKKKEKIGGEEVRFLSFQASGQDVFGPPFLSLACDLPAAGRYAVAIEAVKGPAAGEVQLFQNEAPAAAAADLHSETRAKTGPVPLGTLLLAEGENHLLLKVVGKNEKATGLGLDLINIICERVE